VPLAAAGNGDEGNRTPCDSASETPISPEGPKNSTQDGTRESDFEAALAIVIANVPEAKRSAILTLVRAAAGDKGR
jgi:hypothetical protein